MNPIIVDEKNVSATATVWSNTTGSGEPAGIAHCVGWTSNSAMNPGGYGSTGAVDSLWTNTANTTACSGAFSIYCFEDPA